MLSEEELLPLSGLQHMLFCQRRWALVQIENTWEDNRFTAEGKVLHEKAHSGDIETRPGVLIRRTVAIRSLRLGLSGQADIVEFLRVNDAASGVELEGRRGRWRPFPVEYKRSKDKAGSLAYRAQLCAQALCLEEMLNLDVPEGAVFDGQTKRRQIISFDSTLRKLVSDTASEMHGLFAAGTTPPPVFKKACYSCSLKERCFPEALSDRQSIHAYYLKFIKAD